MESIKLQSHAGPDGVLKIEVPVGISNTDYEVMVIVQAVKPASPASETSSQATSEELGWPPGFFELTAGSLADDPIERQPQQPL